MAGDTPKADPPAMAMQFDPAQTIYYRRTRFTSRLPTDRLYTPSHFWLAEQSPGLWYVGLTKFALRMLGDLVELGFQPSAGDEIQVGQTIGWVEGFKALSDLYSVANGEFVSANPALDQDITLIDTKPYADGWLYQVRGQPEKNAVDVHGYIEFLNLTIDKMKEELDAKSNDC